MRILGLRCFELKSDVHDVFDNVWKALVRVDVVAGKVAIYDTIDGMRSRLRTASVTPKLANRPSR